MKWLTFALTLALGVCLSAVASADCHGCGGHSSLHHGGKVHYGVPSWSGGCCEHTPSYKDHLWDDYCCQKAPCCQQKCCGGKAFLGHGPFTKGCCCQSKCGLGGCGLGLLSKLGRCCSKFDACRPSCCTPKCCAPAPCCRPRCCKPRCCNWHMPKLRLPKIDFCRPRCCQPKCCPPPCCHTHGHAIKGGVVSGGVVYGGSHQVPTPVYQDGHVYQQGEVISEQPVQIQGEINEPTPVDPEAIDVPMDLPLEGSDDAPAPPVDPTA